MSTPDQDCCADDPPAAATDCPDCGRTGRSVAAGTLASLVMPERLPQSLEGYCFCRTRGCDTVYFAPGQDPVGEDAITVRVGCKQADGPMLVCYCFEVTRAKIAEQCAGVTRASERIAGWMNTGACDCLHKNPSGRCCLGEVRALEKVLLEQQEKR